MPMRPFTSLTPFPVALARACALVRQVEATETVDLRKAGHRILAVDVAATADVPAHARAAMDGYAVRAAEIAGASPDQSIAMPVVDDAIYAGGGESAEIPEGHVARIATGGLVPPGADSVAPVEWTVDATGTANPVRFTRAPALGQHVVRPGSDMRAGEPVLDKGVVLAPGALAALAGTGEPQAEVFERPHVTLFTTGNEIAAPGATLAPGQVFDVNSYSLQQVVERTGALAQVRPNARDELEALTAAIGRAVDAGTHIAVTAGGASVGERDLVARVVDDLGTVHIHGIAIQPGKPTLVGTIGETLVVGLPGNPASCLVLGYVFLAPIIRRCARRPDPAPATAPATFRGTARSDPKRHHFLPVRLDNGDAHSVFRGSGATMSMAHADGFVEIPPGEDGLADGAAVTVTRLAL